MKKSCLVPALQCPGAELQSGFTLIELLVVVLIVGILSAVALPQYQKAVAKARFTQLITAGKSFKDAMEVYYLANGDYPTWWRDVDIAYAGCTESSSARYMLYCDKFAADLFASASANLSFYDTSFTGNAKALSQTEIIAGSQFNYTVWLDHSEFPGKTSCSSKIAGLCESMGFE